jgi:tetratricopeptide (TPR) repeat protein
MISDAPSVARLARRIRLLAVCVGVLVFAQGARAETQPETTYRELIEQALSEFQLKNWPEARVLFRRAHEISPNARTLRGMGVVSFEMRDYVQTVEHLSAALAETRQPLTEAQRAECQSLLARALTFVGSYAVHVDPEGAQLTLDGAPPVRDREGRVLVSFGEHVLRATAEGYTEASTRLRVQGGERAEITLRLTPIVSAEPEPLAASEQDVPAALDEQPAWRGGGLRYTWVAVGAGAAFGAAAVASWFLGADKLDALDARCQRRAEAGDPCERGSTDVDTVKLYERLTNASLGLTAAAVVAAGALLAVEWPRERRLAVSMGPTSLFVRGSF